MCPIIPQILVWILKGTWKGKAQVLHRSPILVKQRKSLARSGTGAIDTVDLDAMAGGCDVKVPAIVRFQ